MSEYRISYQELEDGIATLILFENDDMQEDFYWDVDEMPDGAIPGYQYRPEFEDGELVALHYDEELTEQKQEDFSEAVEWYNEMLEDN